MTGFVNSPSGLYGGQSALLAGSSLSTPSGLLADLLPLPSLLLNFAGSVYQTTSSYPDAATIPGYSFTRSSGGYAENLDGSLTWFAGTRTNLVKYSQDLTNTIWIANFGAGSSITRTGNFSTAPDGTTTATRIEYNNLNYTQVFEQISTTTSTPYTFSVWLKSNTASNQAMLIGDNVTAPMLAITVTPTWQRFSTTVTTLSTVFIARILAANTGAYDFLAWGAQVETATDTRLTYPTAYIPTTTAAVSVDTPRITNKGYLSEEARTNSIRNSTMVGASAGVSPTNWVLIGGGATVTVIGVGVENSLNYVDIRFNGTSTGVQIKPDGNVSITGVSTGQSWSFSTYIKLISGTLTNVSAVSLYTSEYSAGPTYLRTQYNIFNFTPTSTATRFAGAVTLGASTTIIEPTVGFTVPTAAVDFTVRIYGIQMELGAFATSYIPTTTAAATRAADAMRYTGYGSALVAPLTLKASVSAYTADSISRRIVSLSDGTTANRLVMERNSSNQISIFSTSGGTSQSNPSFFSGYSGSFSASIAERLTSNQTALSVGGGTTLTSAVNTAPVGMSYIDVGQFLFGSYFNSYIQNVTIYPTALTDQQLQAITA